MIGDLGEHLRAGDDPHQIDRRAGDPVQRRLSDARQLLSAALDIDSTWMPAVLHHGQAYADLLATELHIRNTQKLIGFDKYQNADAELDEAEALFPTHPKIPELRDLIRKKREDNTKIILAKLPEEKRKAYEAAMQAAAQAMNQTKYAEAMQRYSEALKIAPESLDAKMGYAEAERLLKQDGSDQKLAEHFKQAEKHEKDRRFAQAISSYDRVLRLEPTNPHAKERKAVLLDFMQQQFAVADPGWWERLPEVTTRTLVISGGTRSFLQPRHLRDLATALPESGFEQFDVGHSVHRDAGPAFNSAVGQFLGLAGTRPA